MKKSFLCAVFLGVWSFVLPGSVLAHHGDAGCYIAEVTSLTGTTCVYRARRHRGRHDDEVDGGNEWPPESGEELRLDVGHEKWVGSRFTVTGRRLKNGAPYINLTDRANIVLADGGQEIFRTANFGDPVPAAEK